MSRTYPFVYLKKREEQRLKQGHLWTYSNEIDVHRSPLKSFSAGDLVEVRSAADESLGIGYINPHSLISVRLLTRAATTIIDSQFLYQQLSKALRLREMLWAEPYYRWVYAESDELPGLIIDRFDKIVVVQITSLGMEQLKSELVTALNRFPELEVIYFKNDSSVRSLEGLENYNELVKGELPSRIMVLENGCAAQIDLTTAQKTGWFYDHRENRAYLSRLVSGKSVLDVFSYVGGWSLLALKKGASQVTAIDSSQAAGTLLLESAQHDARLNFIHEDAFKALKQLREQQRCFEVIILDPPAFIKKRKDLRDGRIAYLRLHQQALRLLAKPGLLVSASCSMLLKSEELQELALQAARAAGRELRLIYRGQQGPDHPIHPAIAETEYLKMLLWWVY